MGQTRQCFSPTLAGAHNRIDKIFFCASPPTWPTCKSRMVDNSTAIEMLMQIKHLMAENHEEYHAEIGQVRQESNDLKQRVKEIEFQTSDVRIHR